MNSTLWQEALECIRIRTCNNENGRTGEQGAVSHGNPHILSLQQQSTHQFGLVHLGIVKKLNWPERIISQHCKTVTQQSKSMGKTSTVPDVTHLCSVLSPEKAQYTVR